MCISATTESSSIERAFRAAFLLTGSIPCAEHAVLSGIAGLDDSGVDLESRLMVKTIECVIRQRKELSGQFEEALALCPPELIWLIDLTPVSRDCFTLRLLFGITPEDCAACLRLTTAEFEESLGAAFVQLFALATLTCFPSPIQTEVVHS